VAAGQLVVAAFCIFYGRFGHRLRNTFTAMVVTLTFTFGALAAVSGDRIHTDRSGSGHHRRCRRAADMAPAGRSGIDNREHPPVGDTPAGIGDHFDDCGAHRCCAGAGLTPGRVAGMHPRSAVDSHPDHSSQVGIPGGGQC